MRHAIAIILAAFIGLSGAPATALDETDIPEVLKPWVPWVLHGQEEVFCPARYNDDARRLCAWPTRLVLTLNAGGGTFRQSWRVYDESWVPLPGGAGRWPQDVEIGGAPATVLDREGTPSVLLVPGEHELRGGFSWSGLPDSLPIPPASGLLDLSVDGVERPFPDIDKAGALWLGGARGSAPAEEDRLTVQVFRRLDDDIPFRVTTRLRLDVSGTHREVVLEGALLADFIPLAVRARLPARLEADGRLRLQVRPGTWGLDVIARHPGPVDRLPGAAGGASWPDDEVWVFAARNELRLVAVEGVPSIDPRRTSLPKKWRKLPAYRVGPGDAMTFATKRRGDPEPAPDQLALTRTLWLDFDGGGYTLHDEIAGTMSAGWRLDMNPPFELGRVTVDGQDRFITRAGDDDRAGVELRRGRLALGADSRLDGPATRLGAVGWDHDFQSARARLNLPPGWRLFHATGADTISTTWLQHWTMLDLFVVLVITLAVTRLWSWRWGLLAVAAVVVTYHEPDAPRWIWLHVLAAVALLRVVPEGLFRNSISWYRNGALLTLAVIVLAFAVAEVRSGLYPQLERPWQRVAQPVGGFLGGRADKAVDAVTGRAQQRALSSEAPREAAKSKVESRLERYFYDYADKPSLQGFDPNARITTGPGLPHWTWTTVALGWNGPVEREQTIDLILIPPWLNLLLSLLGVALVGALSVLLLATRIAIRLPARRAAATLAVGAIAALTLWPPGEVRADVPDAALLDELRERLLETPTCFPHCAQSPFMDLEVDGDRMTVRYIVHAAEAVAVPLPGDDGIWRLRRVEVDGEPAPALRRDEGRGLWLRVPAGRHTIVMDGELASASELALPLPLKPRRVAVRLAGWRIDGIDEEGVPEAQLQLTRLRQDEPQTAGELEPRRLPPFVQVERALLLGLEWRTLTRVVRDRATTGAVVVKVPLLEGEAVISPNVRVEDGRVLVNMTPKQREVRWTSTIEKAPSLTLSAPRTSAWSERWRLDASPIWRVRSDGPAPIFHQDGSGLWRPVWQPWPGETLILSVARPEGVEGATLTVDSTMLKVRPGSRSSDVTLEVDLRSSQGAQHVIGLPEGARLEAATIDGRPQPLRLQDGTVTVPIAPGRHKLSLRWRDRGTIAARFATPRVELGLPSVNAQINVTLPRDRWVLLARGPALGPAVLFWGVLLVVAAVAFGLGRVTLTPLRAHHWLLLGIGLTQAPIPIALLVVGWLLALGARARLPESVGKGLFNLIQVGLAVLTVGALVGLFYAVQQGLLGLPEMQVIGNRSTAYDLNWYQDRAGAALPGASVISVSIWFYKILMLAWALWLAIALLRWLRWGWSSFATGGAWRSFRIRWRRPPRRQGEDEPESAT